MYRVIILKWSPRDCYSDARCSFISTSNTDWDFKVDGLLLHFSPYLGSGLELVSTFFFGAALLLKIDWTSSTSFQTVTIWGSSSSAKVGALETFSNYKEHSTVNKLIYLKKKMLPYVLLFYDNVIQTNNTITTSYESILLWQCHNHDSIIWHYHVSCNLHVLTSSASTENKTSSTLAKESCSEGY